MAWIVAILCLLLSHLKVLYVTRATRSFAVSNHVSTDNWALSECMQHTNQLEEYWIQTLFIFTFIWCSNLKEKRKTIVWHFKINYFVSNTNLRKLNWTLCCCKLKERKKPASQKQSLFSAIFDSYSTNTQSIILVYDHKNIR